VAEIMRLQSRFLFRGELVLQTALHIGGGDSILGTTDNPVLRRVDEQPFIPGSSLKGAFRSTVEKLAASLELPNMHRDALDLSAAWIREFHERCRQEAWDTERTVQEVEREWPVTGLLFGTPYTASRISFADAYLTEGQDSVIQRRDGVAIDRDSERAVDGLKYDYEVVPPTLRFDFEMRLENPTSMDLSLTCMGLAELLSGFFSLGGKRSSGLGRCQLDALQIYMLDLSSANIADRAEALRQYLTGRTLAEKFGPSGIREDPHTFIEQHISRLLQEIQ
jgi:CRISPR-associated RAMP protein (TIGR02581 family)